MPEDLVRRAKVLAAQRDTSVSALVAQLLEGLVGSERTADAWEREKVRMRSGLLEVGEVTWSRDDVHER